MLWISVLDDAIWTIIENPTGSSSKVENQKFRESENNIRLAPKPAQASITQLPSPRTPCLPASTAAPSNAPIPDEPIRTPRAFGPPFKILSANIGIRTEYGIPIRLTTP